MKRLLLGAAPLTVSALFFAVGQGGFAAGQSPPPTTPTTTTPATAPLPPQRKPDTRPRLHPVKGCNSAHCDYQVRKRTRERAAVAARARAREIARLPSAGASWFYDAGGTACGTHYAVGVAHRTLACGTRVMLCALRCAVAVVEDRGPYVAGRDWDLNPGAKAAIGFGDVGLVRWRIVR